MPPTLRTLGTGDFEVEYVPGDPSFLRITQGEHAGLTFADTTGLTEELAPGYFLLASQKAGYTHAILRPMIFADSLSMAERREARVRIEVPGPAQKLRRILLVGSGSARLDRIDVPGVGDSELEALGAALDTYADDPACRVLKLPHPIAVREQAVDLFFSNPGRASISTPRVLLEFCRKAEELS